MILHAFLYTTIMFTEVTSEQQVLTAIKKLKPNMTKGHDQVPAFLVRDCAYVFMKPLTIIFNFRKNGNILEFVRSTRRV
jgi:hypothetical protein